MNISGAAFSKFAKRLSKIRTTASDEILAYINKTGIDKFVLAGYDMTDFINHAYGIATKYGEAAGALSAELYDAIAQLSGVPLPPAEIAPTPSYNEIKKTVYGVRKQSRNPNMLADAIGRQVKKVGAETTLRNAERDHAQYAWIPQGDTCAFCIMVASNGWQHSNYSVDHLHANCDCEYCARFDNSTKVGGYDPQKYKDMYDDAEGATWEDKLNSMRRDAYAENKEEINEQKRDAYEKRQELNSSEAEELET